MCGVRCTEPVVWESKSKIKITTPVGRGCGPIIVTTDSGGTGTCTVEYTYEHVEEPKVEELETKRIVGECG